MDVMDFLEFWGQVIPPMTHPTTQGRRKEKTEPEATEEELFLALEHEVEEESLK